MKRGNVYDFQGFAKRPAFVHEAVTFALNKNGPCVLSELNRISFVKV